MKFTTLILCLLNFNLTAFGSESCADLYADYRNAVSGLGFAEGANTMCANLSRVKKCPTSEKRVAEAKKVHILAKEKFNRNCIVLEKND